MEYETTVVKVETPDECCGEKTYWVNLRGGHVRVGRAGESEPFMEWQDPEPFKQKHHQQHYSKNGSKAGCSTRLSG
ncbi:hypothetical protein HAZT_HAZT007290 [Hyalella azteca]|uniref:Farnesoic acid O-methyl transferase domain-containing protein n=1 Tax=Hyalella azteca TaxID=294128 RepID=A0A6A0H6P7_HYAAZ|nr:hypothetical protein HAZT_HAZT007290 [Hyalella azteca]